MEKNYFSIAIPAYKDKFLKDAICSVIAQSYANWELIILNDASPYDIDPIVNEFNDDRIKYFRNDVNCGAINVVDNWNKCLQLATGKWFLCMGDDDVLLENCLQSYLDAITSNDTIDIFHGCTIIMDENGKPLRMQDGRPEVESLLSAINYRMDYRQQFIGDYLFRTDRLRSIGGFHKMPLAWGSDDITVYKMIGENVIVNLNVPVFCYRNNALSITSSGNSDIKMSATMDLKKWIEHCVTKIIPSSFKDEMFKNIILKRLDNHIKSKKAHVVIVDLYSNGLSRLPHWIKVRKKYELSVPLLAYCFVESLKYKYQRHES